jgi:electron transport complex protein RnfE
MSKVSLIDRFKTGLWYENPGLVQLLGLCPLLAVTSTFVNGLGLGIATLAVMTASNALVSSTRRWIRREIRIPIYVLIIASLVTCTELVFKAWFPALDRSLGIFIPLIVTNCAIVARAEIFASRNPVGASIIDGLVMGTGLALLLMALGAFRELVAMGWLLAILPPGAFFSLALAIAAKNAIDRRRRERRSDALPRRSRLLNR